MCISDEDVSCSQASNAAMRNVASVDKIVESWITLMQASETLVLSKLLVEGSNRRIYHVDRHAGAVST